MSLNRRRTLALVGVSVALPGLAGCTGGGTDASTSVDETETFQLPVRTGTGPQWLEEDATGRAVVVDSEERAETALAPYELRGGTEELQTFLDDTDFETDRLVLVESTGPDACHGRLAVADVRVEDGQLRASATVTDESDGGVACAEVVTYPSTLLRVTFEGDPLDEATVDVTDGWGEQSTVTASADDPLSSDS